MFHLGMICGHLRDHLCQFRTDYYLSESLVKADLSFDQIEDQIGYVSSQERKNLQMLRDLDRMVPRWSSIVLTLRTKTRSIQFHSCLLFDWCLSGVPL